MLITCRLGQGAAAAHAWVGQVDCGGGQGAVCAQRRAAGAHAGRARAHARCGNHDPDFVGSLPHRMLGHTACPALLFMLKCHVPPLQALSMLM